MHRSLDSAAPRSLGSSHAICRMGPPFTKVSGSESFCISVIPFLNCLFSSCQIRQEGGKKSSLPPGNPSVMLQREVLIAEVFVYMSASCCAQLAITPVQSSVRGLHSCLVLLDLLSLDQFFRAFRVLFSSVLIAYVWEKKYLPVIHLPPKIRWLCT